MKAKVIGAMVAMLLAAGGTATAEITIDTVHVGDPSNVGELSGSGAAGGFGIDRICGSVAYEYNIGKYEVTAGQYTAFLNAVVGVDTYALYNTDMSRTDNGCGITRSGGGTVGDPYTYSVMSAFVNRPVNYVSLWDACRFANWLSNGQQEGAQNSGTTEDGAYTLNGYNKEDGWEIQRNPGAMWAITSEDEWYKAAYYKGGGTNAGYWDYPTSSDEAPGRDMADASGNNANYESGAGPYPIDSGKYTTIVGEFQNSPSPYGTFDQAGNLWEWNEAVLYGSTRSLRGGAFSRDTDVMLASDRYDGLSPSNEANRFGFRVSEVPEPATLSLLALLALSLPKRGVLAVIRRKK